MSDVKRYDAMTGYIVEAKEGECVLFSDYQKIQARVRELDELIDEISPATWDDKRMKYVNVQVSRGTYDRIQSLKGTP